MEKELNLHKCTGTHAGHIVFILRITLTTKKHCHLPFTLTWRQFPIKPSYAITSNKSQGQTVTKVGIYLPQSVFTHGQLNVAIQKLKAIMVYNLHWHRHQRTL